MSDNITFNNTNNISKNINQYTTDVVNNYETNKASNLKKPYYNFIDDVVVSKHNTLYTNGSISVIKINKLINFYDNIYFTKKNRTYK